MYRPTYPRAPLKFDSAKLSNRTASETSVDDDLIYVAGTLVDNGPESEAELGVYAAFDEDSIQEN